MGDPNTLCSAQLVEPISPNNPRSGINFAIFPPALKTGQEPVILFIHGVICLQLGGDGALGLLYTQGFVTLFSCLARSGFICVSIQPDPDNNNSSVQARADRMKSVQADVHTTLLANDYGPLNNRSVVLMGHSRGGEAAILAAGLLAMSNEFDVQVRAVISLAPADLTASTLPGTVPSYLALCGTLDADVRYAGVRETFFDEIEGESTSKYLIGIVGGSHIGATDFDVVPSDTTCEPNLGNQFFDINGGLLLSGAMYRTAQARLISAFLRWKIYSQGSSWSDYFRNRASILSDVNLITTFRESGEQAIGGQAFAGQGFSNHLPGQIPKEPVADLFDGTPDSSAYRIKWLNNVTPLRLFFTTTIFPSPLGALLVDISIITKPAPNLASANNGDHLVQVTLLANCDDPLGCGAVATPPGWPGPGNKRTYTIRMLPRLQPVLYANVLTDFSVNGIHTLCVSFSDFGVNADFLSSVQVIVIEFLEPSGDLVVFEPRYRL